ncbi:MAG: HEAT repeat domain-containing protein [Blastocatellia bacterium]
MKQLQKRGLLLILWLLFGSPMVARSQSNPADSSLEHARELWEMAIAAKGGREKLHQISNLLFIGEGGTSITFWVFPDKYFSWGDTRPSVFGLEVSISNYETGFGYSTAFSNPPQVKVEKDIRQHKDNRSHLLFCQIEYLLETKWIQLEVLQATKSTVGGKRVDLVDVQVKWYTKSYKFGVFLDEKTHLPVRVGSYSTFKPNEFYTTVDMRAYRDFLGIKLPTELSWRESSDWTHPRFEINAEYDPQFFNRVPDLNSGPFQWRKAGSTVPPAPVATIEKPEPLNPAQIAQYILELESPDEDMSVSARRELVTAGRQAVPALTEALKSGSLMPRFRAAVVLLEIDKENPAAMAALPGFLLDPQMEKAERQNAAFGLLRNDRGIAVLTELLLHPDSFVRRCVIFAFDELTERREIPSQVEKALPALRDLTRDKDEVVRKMAKEVLEQIGDRFKR